MIIKNLAERSQLCLLYSVLFFLILQENFTFPSTKEQFYRNFAVDNTLKQLLDKHCEEMVAAFQTCKKENCVKAHKVYRFPWMPEYYVKLHLHRLIGAQILQECIKKNNLNLLVIPEKYIYNLKGKPNFFKKENYFVLSQNIQEDINAKNQPFDLNQVQQISTLIKETKFFDLGKKNYLRLSDKKIAIIDTGYWKPDERNIFVGLAKFTFDSHNINTDFTHDALKYLFLELARAIPTSRPDQYEHIYKHLEQYLLRSSEEKTASWDYMSFFYKNFPVPPLTQNNKVLS